MPTPTPTPAQYDAAGTALRTLVGTLRDAFGARTFDDGSDPDPVVTSRYLATDFPREVRRAEEAIADALPALTPADFLKACNGDHALRAEVTRFRDAGWTMADVSELRDGDGEHDGDGETWTILRGSSRFEVRGSSRFEVRKSDTVGNPFYTVHDNETNEDADDTDAVEALGIEAEYGFSEEQARALVAAMDRGETCYVVWDTDNGHDARDLRDRDFDFDSYDPADESSADDAAAEGNREDYQQNANGWPFAHNYAAAIDERDADDFAAAGFVVATHEPSGQVYAGIDGGGYSFLEAHWAPLYLRMMLTAVRGYGVFRQEGPTHIYVPTRDGLRRVVRGE